MSDEVPSDAGRRFAADLRAIREARGVSIDTLHDETKIPIGLLESFESTGLFDHPMFNRVYLRSFVRTYADVTGIAPSAALAGLEEALDGSYTDRLAVEYLGQTPTEKAPEPAASAPAESPPPADEPEEAAEPDALEPTEAAAPPPSRPEPRRATPERPPAERPSPERSPEPDRARPSFVPTGETPRRQWGMIALIGAVLVAAVIGILSLVGGDGEGDDAAADPQEEVSAEAAPVSTPDAPARPAVAVGDTIDVRVVSQGEPVRWLRVTIDDDVRRPYWIEAGESLTLRAAERMMIEDAPANRTTGQLERIRLEVEGNDFPTSRRDEQGRIVLTREAIESFYATQ